MADRETTLSPVFRAAFAQVWEPKSYNNGPEKFSVTMVFPKDADLKKMRAMAKKAAKDKWGDKIPKNLRSPFRDGSEKDHLDGFDDTVIFVTASSKYRPGIVDQNVEKIIDQSEFYSGVYARASLTAYAYDVSGNKGVAFGLQNLQKIKDGTPFGGRSDASDDFDAVEVEEGEVAASEDEDDDFLN